MTIRKCEEAFAKEGCMDVVVEDGVLYAISNESQSPQTHGCLKIFSIDDPFRPRLLAVVDHLGNARQLKVLKGYAFVAAREQGLWVIDVRSPLCPRIACQYDTLEFATGLGMEGNLLYVACRTFGVEVIDVRNPEQPAHVAILRTGEAQSVAVQNGIVYSGVWGTQEVVIYDARDLRNPQSIARVPLQGRGDGVCVRGNLLYAVTGQHRRTENGHWPTNLEDMAFGQGWGLEIFDIRVPRAPRRLSRLDMTEKVYHPSYDMWSVQVVGKYAFLTLSFLGAFVVDVENPRQPRLLTRYFSEIRRDEPGYRDISQPQARCYRVIALNFEAKETLLSPMTNLALGEGVVYLASGASGLHALKDERARSPKAIPPYVQPCLPDASSRPWAAENGQVRAVCRYGDRVFAACGGGGLRIFKITPEGNLTSEQTVPLPGLLRDVKVRDGKLFLCAASQGFHILAADTLAPIGSYCDDEGQNIDQIELSPDGRFALLHVGFRVIRFLDVSNPKKPVPVMEDSMTSGLYCRQICIGAWRKRYMGVFWNSREIRWYDVGGKQPQRMDWTQPAIGFENGLAAGMENVFALFKGGLYAIHPDKDQKFVAECRLPFKENVSGKLHLSHDEKKLFISDRIGGEIWAIDLGDLNNPSILFHEKTGGSPDLVATDEEYTIWALGNAGIRLSKC